MLSLRYNILSSKFSAHKITILVLLIYDKIILPVPFRGIDHGVFRDFCPASALISYFLILSTIGLILIVEDTLSDRYHTT